MNKKLVKYAASFLMLTLIFTPVVVLAQNFGEDIINNVNVPRGERDLGQVVVNIVNWVLGFLALVAIVIVLIGGFEWMTAGGSEDKVTTAKSRLKYGLIGLAIIFLAWSIVQFVLARFAEWAT